MNRGASAAGSRELLSPVDLCLANGALAPDAVGWSRRPLHRCNVPGGKRWNWWGVTDGRLFFVALVASVEAGSLGLVSLTDLASGAQSDRAAPFAPRGRVELGDRPADGARLRWLGVELELGARRLVARAGPIEADLELVPAGDNLSTVVPRPDGSFWYTSKQVGIPARGRVTWGGRRIDIDGWAALDFGRGLWRARGMRWNWAVGASPNLSFNLGARWTDGTGATENGLIVDGVLHKIATPVRFDSGFSIRGDDVDLHLETVHERRVGLPPLLGLLWRPGVWRGVILGRRIDGLVGWAEALDLP